MPAPTKLKKNPRLPPTHRVSKRAPLRPAIPSPYTSARSPKIIYIRPSTPFVSALKRAQKLLELVAKREDGRDKWPHMRREDRRRIQRAALGEDDERGGEGVGDKREGRGVEGGKGEGREEVIFKGMGKAIQKVLELALWFEGRREWRVRVRTGSTGVVDDIVEKEGGAEEAGEGMDVDEVDLAVKKGDDGGEVYKENEIPDARIRKVSVLEVGISWR